MDAAGPSPPATRVLKREFLLFFGSVTKRRSVEE